MSNFNLVGPSGQLGKIRITPKDSADLSDIEANIHENLSLIEDWVSYGPTPKPEEVGWLIGSGPSLAEALKMGYLTEGMFQRNPLHSVWLAKHALPYFKDWAIPLSCVVLDPRPIDGVSTHGHTRLGLYQAAPPQTIFYVASMTSATVTRWLLSNGYKVIGWHASSNALTKFASEVRTFEPKAYHKTVTVGPLSIGGGTNSILRAIGLLKECFGITRTRLLGVDNTLETPCRDTLADPAGPWFTDKDTITGAPMRIQSSYGNGNKVLWTTGELLAACQDVEAILANAQQFGIETKVVGTDKQRSLTGQIWDAFQK